MTWWEQARQLPLWLLGPAGAAAALVLWRGWLSPAALRDAPSRRLGFHAADAMVVAGLTLTGMSFAALVMMRVKDAKLTPYICGVIAAQLLSLGMPAVYLGVRASFADRGFQRIGYLPTRWARDLGAGAVGSLLALALVPGVILLASLVGLALGFSPREISHDLLEKLRDSDSPAGSALLMFSAIVVAPILEEAVYRGTWQSMLVEGLGERRRWPAVLIAATIFAAVHVGGVRWQALAALWVLGVLLGWLYERTGSLLPCVTVHAAFNGFNIAWVMLFVEPTTTTQPINF